MVTGASANRSENECTRGMQGVMLENRDVRREDYCYNFGYLVGKRRGGRHPPLFKAAVHTSISRASADAFPIFRLVRT